MIKIFINTVIVFLLSLHLLSAQSHKGLWMLDGTAQISRITFNTSTTDIFVNPKVSVGFAKKWVVGGELSIELIDKVSWVGHGLSMRYYFICDQPTQLYAKLFYSNQIQRSLQPNSNSGYFQFIDAGPGLGILHFFNQNIALDIEMNYNVFSQFRNQERVISTQNGGIGLSIGVKYFFGSRLSPDSLFQEVKFKKKTLVIGGQVIFGPTRRSIVRNFTNANNVQPYIGYFLTKNILLGSGINYNNDISYTQFILGFSPFGRYYLQLWGKRKLFAEVNSLYNIIWRKFNDDVAYERSKWSRSLGLAIGLTNQITPKVSFDVKASLNRNGIYNEGTSKWINFRTFNVGMGLQAYIN